MRVTPFFVVTATLYANAFQNSAKNLYTNGFRIVLVVLNEVDLFSVAQWK